MVKMVEKNNRKRQYKFSEETRRKMSEARRGKYIGENHHNYKGGRLIRNGYYYILDPDRKFQQRWRYIQEHRYIMEQHLGRKLTKDEDVHHINGNKLDNRIENLQLMTKAEHTKHHLLEQGFVINQFGTHKIRLS